MYVISFVYLCGFTQIYSHVSCLDMYGHVYLPFIIFTHTHIYIYIYTLKHAYMTVSMVSVNLCPSRTRCCYWWVLLSSTAAQKDLQRGQGAKKKTEFVETKSMCGLFWNMCTYAPQGPQFVMSLEVKTLQKTSAAEACRDAKGLLTDQSDCKLASLLASWSMSPGHEERSFERCSNQNKKNVKKQFKV